jgi:hypothetical protein
MSDEVPKIIAFKPRDNGDVVRIKERSKCRHHSFEVDMEARTVECAQCHEFLDPIFVVYRLSEIYTERDYKYDAIQAFERKEEDRRSREYARRLAKTGQQQQDRLQKALEEVS